MPDFGGTLLYFDYRPTHAGRLKIGKPRRSELASDPDSEGTSMSQPAGDRLNILIVEDTPINQKVLLAQLRALGYTADCVSNGQAALDKIDKM